VKRNGLSRIKYAVSISERPASIEGRAVTGHREGDLIGGPKSAYMATFVERHSRFVMLGRIANKETKSFVAGLIKSA